MSAEVFCWVIAGLMSGCLFLAQTAQAVPLTYAATYRITDILTSSGTNSLPAEWGGVDIADYFYARLVWDADAAVPIDVGTYAASVVDYALHIGTGIIGPIGTLSHTWWPAGSDTIGVVDNVPVSNIGPGMFNDEAIFRFSCGSWAALPDLPTNLACGNALQGSIFLSAQPHVSYPVFELRAELTDLKLVPEPGTLALLGLGLTGLAFSRKRQAA